MRKEIFSPKSKTNKGYFHTPTKLINALSSFPMNNVVQNLGTSSTRVNGRKKYCYFELLKKLCIINIRKKKKKKIKQTLFK